MKTEKGSKPGQKSATGEAVKSLVTKLSPSSMKKGKQTTESTLAALTKSVLYESGGQGNSNDKGNTLPPLGDVDLSNDTPYTWARNISNTVEKALDLIQGEAEQKQILLDQGHDPWNSARDNTRSFVNAKLNPRLEIYLKRLEAGEDCHADADWDSLEWPTQLKPLVDLAGSQLQKDRRLMGTLSPAEFVIWKIYQPGCYWYFRVILMSCNIPGEDWLGVMRVAQEVPRFAGENEAIMKSFKG